MKTYIYHLYNYEAVVCVCVWGGGGGGSLLPFMRVLRGGSCHVRIQRMGGGGGGRGKSQVIWVSIEISTWKKLNPL